MRSTSTRSPRPACRIAARASRQPQSPPRRRRSEPSTSPWSARQCRSHEPLTATPLVRTFEPRLPREPPKPAKRLKSWFSSAPTAGGGAAAAATRRGCRARPSRSWTSPAPAGRTAQAHGHLLKAALRAQARWWLAAPLLLRMADGGSQRGTQSARGGVATARQNFSCSTGASASTAGGERPVLVMPRARCCTLWPHG